MNIADMLRPLLTIKTNIKAAIRDKGVEISDSTPFADYADKIRSITGGGATGYPIEVATMAELELEVTEDNIGKVYSLDDLLYIVEADDG